MEKVLFMVAAHNKLADRSDAVTGWTMIVLVPIPKPRKSKNTKSLKFKNPKTPKPRNPKILKLQTPEP